MTAHFVVGQKASWLLVQLAGFIPFQWVPNARVKNAFSTFL